jgi:hypothetical protein
MISDHKELDESGIYGIPICISIKSPIYADIGNDDRIA